jgi:hypothetical protein
MLQRLLGTTVDGVVSSQSRTWAPSNPGLTTGWQWVAPRAARGSRVILAHQQLLAERGRYRGDLDGLAGRGYFRALQRDLDMGVVDGEIWNPSATVRALQRRLNAGRI